jgi:hypothetical protein
LVFCVQANFIKGGLMLTLVAQHNVMDMTGQDFIVNMLSKACHNKSFTSEEIATGNIDRSNIIPLLDDSYELDPELDRQLMKPLTSAVTLPRDNLRLQNLPGPILKFQRET